MDDHLLTLESSKQTKNLELKLECDRDGQTIVTHQYTAYPLGISRTFRHDPENTRQAHLYITSSSPGLLANDELNISLQLTAETQLHLTDQSATKVHPMPIAGSKAIAHYDIEIQEGATLEFVPEPIILFRDATLEQTINIKCHPTAKLFYSEIIVPGRLARGEFYEFNHYFSRLQVTSLENQLWFTDAMRLEGKLNPFKNSDLFARASILCNVIVIQPKTDLALLSASLEDIEAANCHSTTVATSILPHNKGLLIRAIASGTGGLKDYLQYALNCFRRLEHQP